MRKIKISPGEYYHICNRGNGKQQMFFDTRDWIRFLFLVVYNQSTNVFYNLGRQVTYYVKHSVFNIPEKDVEKIKRNKTVELVSFTLMPNHFHILLREITDNGVAVYMQRIQNAYTKYFNVKYKKSGHLLQGPFRVVHIKTNDQLLHVSAYIHRNPRELLYWRNKEHKYPWSSYGDFVGVNRWSDLLKHEIITEQFNTIEDYAIYVKKSSTKLLPKELTLD